VSDELRRLGQLSERLRHAALLERWAKSTQLFAYEAPLLTVDEHDADARKPFPIREDAEFYWRRVDSGEWIWVIKSRQNMVSWDERAADLQLACFQKHSRIALVFDDLEDAVDHIEGRIKPMFESAPDWFRDRYKVRNLKGVFAIDSCNGERWQSIIEPVARGRNKLRSRVYTRINWEEASTQDWMETAYKGAKATVQGRMGLDGVIRKGQLVVISTPIPNTFYLTLGGDAAVRDRAIEVARGDREPDVDLVRAA
jgi:hypothetical protein